MCGSATLAMEVSSTSMNVASVTVSAMIQGLTADARRRRRSMVAVAALISNPDLGLDRHAGTQLVILVCTGFEDDLHRNALHDFHVVAGGVFRRQQAEARAAGAGDAVDLAVVGSAVGVDVDGDALAGFISRSCVSLKFAVTQMSSRLMIFINSCPGATFWPTSTVRLLTMPFTGATIFVYCRLVVPGRDRFLALRFGQCGAALGARDLHLLGAVLA